MAINALITAIMRHSRFTILIFKILFVVDRCSDFIVIGSHHH
jgi:hypothetical protein